MRTTVVYAPHPDDETLRLCSFVALCAARGDRLILVAVTDGEATGAAQTLGFTAAQVAGVRRAEQSGAWAALTGGAGSVIRLQLPDGEVVPAATRTLARALEFTYGPAEVEHYVAAHPDDRHPDHQAVAEGVASSGAAAVWYAYPTGTSDEGTAYVPGDLQAAVQAADEAFRPVGHVSVPRSFEALRASGYTNRVTRSPSPAG